MSGRRLWGLVIFIGVGVLYYTIARDSLAPATPEELRSEVLEEAEILPLPLNTEGTSLEWVAGLTWAGDTLLILPEDVFEAGRLYTLTREALVAAVNGSAQALTPERMPVSVSQLPTSGLVGRALSSIEGKLYLSGHKPDPQGSRHFVFRGEIRDGALVLDARSIEIPGAQGLIEARTHSYNSLVAGNGGVVALFGVNGKNANPERTAIQVSYELDAFEKLPISEIEYGVYDTTSADEAGGFWAINYFYPYLKSTFDPAPDQIVIQHGVGRTHQQSTIVERIVKLQVDSAGVSVGDAKPVYLSLEDVADFRKARAWYGLARLDDHGLLLMTRRYPRPILAYVHL